MENDMYNHLSNGSKNLGAVTLFPYGWIMFVSNLSCMGERGNVTLPLKGGLGFLRESECLWQFGLLMNGLQF